MDKTVIQKDTCTPMFTAALFIILKTWKQPQCPSTDEWIKMWYIYTHIHNGILLSYKKWNNAICSNMNTTRDYQTKWSKSERGQIPHDITYMCTLKFGTNEPIYKIETDSHRKQTYGYQRWGERDKWGVWD